MSSKGDNVLIYISKTIMSSVITCLQKATMSLFAFRRWQCLQSLHAFKRWQCPYLHFEDDNVFSHFMLSDLHLHFEDDDVFIHCMLSNLRRSLMVQCLNVSLLSKSKDHLMVQRLKWPFVQIKTYFAKKTKTNLTKHFVPKEQSILVKLFFSFLLNERSFKALDH